MTNLDIIELKLKALNNQNNQSIYKVDYKIAVDFNRWAKSQFSSEYEKAIKIRNNLTKVTHRNGREVCYWISHSELPELKPYLKRPTQAQLLADIIVLLIAKNPIIF